MSSSKFKQMRGLLILGGSYQADLQLHLFLFNTPFRFNSTPTFLRVTFSKHVSFLKAKFFPRLKALLCSLLPRGAPLRSFSLFCIKLFFDPTSLMLQLGSFFFLLLPTLPNWDAFTKWLVAPSLGASVLSYTTSLRSVSNPHRPTSHP